MPGVTIAFEGSTDAPALRKLLASEGFEVYNAYPMRGKSNLDRSLRGFNNAAQFSPWLVVRDLDRGTCPARLARDLLPAPSRWMRFRIAVREMEAWLLADGEAVAAYLGVKRRDVPSDPDLLDDPKQTLVNIARRSRRTHIRHDMVPVPGLSADIGPAYSSRITEFVDGHWRPEIAAANSPSLRRCIERVRELAAHEY